MSLMNVYGGTSATTSPGCLRSFAVSRLAARHSCLLSALSLAPRQPHTLSHDVTHQVVVLKRTPRQSSRTFQLY